jgi:membrane dipeptidase
MRLTLGVWQLVQFQPATAVEANLHLAVRATLEQIDTYHRLSTAYPEIFTLAPNAAAAEEAFNNGKLISPLAIEGLHQIGNSLSTLRLYHQLGVRYATLTWNCHNRYADAALITNLAAGETVTSEPYWHGLSPAGNLLVTEMNRLGMIVDISHVSKDTMIDVLGGGDPAKTNGSIAPPIFSHSSAFGICPHPRNVPDDVLDLVRKRDSLVMINFSPDFVACKASSNSSTGLPDSDPENATLDQVVRHIVYIGERIGYDHVGIGTDFDGIETTPKGLEDVSKFPDLVSALLKAGVSDTDAAKVVGRNLLRVWHEVDRVAKELQKTMLPLEDEIVPW